jgi:hypothetical protein
MIRFLRATSPAANFFSGYLEKGIQNPMAQGRSTQIISKIEWIWTSRLSIKNSLSPLQDGGGGAVFGDFCMYNPPPPQFRVWGLGFRVKGSGFG